MFNYQGGFGCWMTAGTAEQDRRRACPRTARAGDLFWAVASLCSASPEGQVHHWETSKKKCSVFQLLRPIGLGPISLSNPRKVKDALVENNSWYIFHRVHFIFCWTLTTSPPENKEDLTQAIFRELGLGETLIVSQSELPAKFLDFLIATEEFWSQWVAGLV